MKHKKLLIIIGILVITSIICIFFWFNNSNDKTEKIPTKENHNSQVTETQKDKLEKDSNVDNKESEQTNIVQEPQKEDVSDSSTNKSNKIEQNVPSTNNVQDSNATNERQCTVKKFYSVFRADFDNFDDCNKKGNELKEKNQYYGFTCDYQTDDCGDIYYMLTFFDGNGNFIDYPSVPKS